MKLRVHLLIIFTVLFPIVALANLQDITWKGTYYGAIPNKKGISQKYCDEHNLGTFTHTTKDSLTRIYTINRGVKLTGCTLNIQEKHGIYLVTGDLYASKDNGKKHWKDHVYFYFSKLTEAGVTRGVWSSGDCKGHWFAKAIKN